MKPRLDLIRHIAASSFYASFPVLHSAIESFFSFLFITLALQYSQLERQTRYTPYTPSLSHQLHRSCIYASACRTIPRFLAFSASHLCYARFLRFSQPLGWGFNWFSLFLDMAISLVGSLSVSFSLY